MRGWLIVVTSRLCLDQIRSARSRRSARTTPARSSSLSRTGTRPRRARTSPPDPADRVTFDDRVRLALLVVLQRLTPAERVVFILHDIFPDAVPPGHRADGRPVRRRRAANSPAVHGRR